MIFITCLPEQFGIKSLWANSNLLINTPIHGEDTFVKILFSLFHGDTHPLAV